MSDNEVGEIWNRFAATGREDRQVIRDLIRKLVEERAKHKAVCWPGQPAWRQFVSDALCDFGIDPKDFS
jgi:hypothetical protein